MKYHRRLFLAVIVASLLERSTCKFQRRFGLAHEINNYLIPGRSRDCRSCYCETHSSGQSVCPRCSCRNEFRAQPIRRRGQAELGRVLQTARFAPSVDIGFGNDHTVTAINLDFRWYLFPLPETGIHFSGAAGPTATLVSPEKGDSQSQVGLSLTGGIKIPTKGGNRYNLQARFGFGDIPDLKMMFGILFAI